MSKPRALITGASAGLGREFAEQFAAKGKDLVLVARRVAPMQALANDLAERRGVQVDVIGKDLSEAAAPARLYEELQQRGVEIDYLVNNAGSAAPDLLEENDWPAAHAYIELMMTSVVAMCQLFVPLMRERRFGRILNVASVAGLVATPGDYNYGPTKAYLIAFSRELAAALKRDGINVCALCPGFTHTDFHASEKLSRMKRSLPKFIWYDADVVVREGLAALEKGRAVYVSGRLYRYFMPVLRSPIGRLSARLLSVRL